MDFFNGLYVVLLVVFVPAVFLSLFNRHLPPWACRVMGWHLRPKEIGFDGASLNGVCPRCGKHVMQDSQGNWF